MSARPAGKSSDRQSELDMLAAGLKSPARNPRKVAATRSAEPGQRGMLIAGVLVLVAGVGYITVMEVTAPEPESAAVEIEPAKAQPVQNSPKFSMPTPPPVAREYLSELDVDGKPAEFFSVENLMRRADDYPITVSVLLRGQLDAYTEAAWREAGMFRDEVLLPSPFLRTVTITNSQAMQNLIDWHVEAVSLVTVNSIRKRSAQK